jgi:hypothetical protein
VKGFCKHGNEFYGSLKREKFLDRLSEHQLLKKNSPPLSIKFLLN